MPLMEIIKRAQKITNPPELTESIGVRTIREFDPATQTYKEVTGTTWRHTKAYFKLRSSHTKILKKQNTEKAQPPGLSVADEHTRILRQSRIDLSQFTQEERAVVMKLLEES